MERCLFRSIIQTCEDERVLSELSRDFSSIEEKVKDGILMTASLFKQNRNLFFYYECTSQWISPLELLPSVRSLLKTRPEESGNLTWIPMHDIFHFSQPLSVEHWRRKRAVQQRVGKIARINPHMLSSYIYYHYLLQEGHSGSDNKYCLIGLDGNLIFYYEELPKTAENRQAIGRLSDILSPDWQDNWQDIMEPHFDYWEDVPADDRKLRPCELLFGC